MKLHFIYETNEYINMVYQNEIILSSFFRHNTLVSQVSQE